MPGSEGRGGREPCILLWLPAVGGVNTAWPLTGWSQLRDGFRCPWGLRAHLFKHILGWCSILQALPSLTHDYPWGQPAHSCHTCCGIRPGDS